MAADTTSVYKKSRKEKVAELMLAMEIEQRRKRLLEVESKNTEEDQGEGDWFDARQILIDIKNLFYQAAQLFSIRFSRL